MARKKNSWLIGCGIGCGGLILIFILIIGGSALLIKNKTKGFMEFAETSQLLEKRFGDIEDFIPSPDGIISSESMEKFLAVRESMRSPSEELEIILQEVVNGEDSVSFRDLFSSFRKGFDFISAITQVSFIRNRSLLDNSMSPGEYKYIYVLAYYSWLEIDPGDGFFHEMTDNIRPVSMSSDDSAEKSQKENNRTAHVNSVKKQAGAYILRMLENQMDMIEENPSAYDKDWIHLLNAEIEAMKRDPLRIPYQDGLPPVIRNSLEPYREHLVSAYYKAANFLGIQ